MSTWTGVNRGTPDSVSDTRCSWSMCTLRVPYRFHDEGVFLCREHALLVWAVVSEQLGAGEEIKPEERERQTYDGVVYYVRTGGRIKIGHSINIERRLAQYPPDVEVLYFRPGDKQLEQSEHRRFRPYLTDGREWFRDCPEVTEPIAELAAADRMWSQYGADDTWWKRRKPADITIRRATPSAT